MRQIKQIVLGSLVAFAALGLVGCGSAQKSATAPTAGTTWQFTKTIAEPIKSTGGNSKAVTLGDLNANQVSVAIPQGALDKDADIQLANPGDTPKYVGSEVNMIGAPIEISVGKPTRLNEKATVSFKVPADQIPAANQVDHLRVAYYDGTGYEYIKPDSVDLSSGTVTFSTYHFSLFGLTKLKSNTKLTEDWIHSKTLDDSLKENINDVTNEIGKKAVDMTLKKMGINSSYTAAVVADMLKDDGYKGLYDQYKKGDVEGFNEKLQLLIGKKISKNVPESAFKEALGSVLEGKDDIAAVSKAAGYIAGGQYEDAAKVIGETISDKFIITTAGKVAIEVINHEIASWKNTEVEAAYTAFKNGSSGYFYGYNVDKGDFNAVWDQMRGVNRQLSIEAIAQENATRHENGMAPLTAQEEDVVRQEVKDAYQSQFQSRMQSEDKMTAAQNKLKKIMDAMDKAGFLDETSAPTALSNGLDTEGRLDVLGHFVDKMMKDTNRFDLTDKTGMIADKAINVDDLVQGARAYFSGPDGKLEYAKFLKDRFNINLGPSLKDLVGKWPGGTLTITDVVVPPDLKDKLKGNKDAEGCDLSIDLTTLKGKTVPIELDIAAKDDKNGTLSLVTKDSQPTNFPFTYDGGVMKGSSTQKGAAITLSLTATDSDSKNFGLSGSINISYQNGLIKIMTSVTDSKAKPAPAPKK